MNRKPDLPTDSVFGLNLRSWVSSRVNFIYKQTFVNGGDGLEMKNGSTERQFEKSGFGRSPQWQFEQRLESKHNNFCEFRAVWRNFGRRPQQRGLTL